MHCRGSQALVPQGTRCECCEHFCHFNSAKTFRCLKVLPSESAVRVLDWSSGMLRKNAFQMSGRLRLTHSQLIGVHAGLGQNL